MGSCSCCRTEAELQEVRAFKEAAQALLKREDRKTAYDLRLARYYMWAQTSATVFLACQVPTGMPLWVGHCAHCAVARSMWLFIGS
jgi:hypothetical protein